MKGRLRDKEHINKNLNQDKLLLFNSILQLNNLIINLHKGLVKKLLNLIIYFSILLDLNYHLNLKFQVYKKLNKYIIKGLFHILVLTLKEVDKMYN